MATGTLPLLDVPPTDGVVTLRAFSLSDAERVYEACQDPEIARWTATIPSPYALSDAVSWIQAHDSMWRSRERAPFAIVDASSGLVLGSLTLSCRSEGSEIVLGYWVSATSRGQGVATRAVRLGLEWVRGRTRASAATLATMVGNVASERVAEKCGFEVVGERSDYAPSGAPGTRFHVKAWRRSLH